MTDEDDEETPYGGDFLAKQLKKYRKRLGLTQVEFAKAAGVSLSLYTKVEAGLCNTTHRTVTRIAHKLGLTTEFLLTGQGCASRAFAELRRVPEKFLRGIATLIGREDVKRLAAEVSGNVGTVEREARAMIIRCMLMDATGRLVTDGPIPSREEWLKRQQEQALVQGLVQEKAKEEAPQ